MPRGRGNNIVVAYAEGEYGSARVQDSSFRMVQHEYVFDETVSRRFVRRYHDSGAQTIFLGLGARSDDPAVLQSEGGGQWTAAERAERSVSGKYYNCVTTHTRTHGTSRR